MVRNASRQTKEICKKAADEMPAAFISECSDGVSACVLAGTQTRRRLQR